MSDRKHFINIIRKMYKKSESFLSIKQKRIIIVISALVLLYLVSYIMDPYSGYWSTYFQRSWMDLVLDWLVSFAFCFSISEISLLIGSRLNVHMPWTDRPVKRLLMESSMNFFVVLLLLFISSIVFVAFGEPQNSGMANTNISIEEKRNIIQWILVSILIAFAIIAVNTGDYLIENWKNAALQAARSDQSAMEAELHALRLQIDPHFVFNNLSVLSELILKDQQMGHLYAENFAKIYRYLLVHSSKDLISLDAELKFLDSYIYLLEQRIGDGVIFKKDIHGEHSTLKLPPLTLQLLVENALKHNKTVRSNPLIISIYCDHEKNLIVENTINLIEKQVPSSGIGLRNIVQRYKLLKGKLPSINTDNGTFTVSVPLIS